MTRRRALLVGVTALAALGTGAVWSNSSSAGTGGGKVSAAAVTPAPGRLLAGNCFQCHGTNGRGGPFEGIAGESAAELYGEMKEMQSKKDEGIMSVHARGYTDEQLRAIAGYFSKAR